ncbi:MAG: SPOR domain-containing protein [Deltaproteobacteria bacterium]|nr:SPOR domain-containing protein [Deltaproteobacteria bacterium]
MMQKEHSALIIGLGSGLIVSLLVGSFFLGALLGPRLFPSRSEGLYVSQSRELPHSKKKKTKKTKKTRRLSKLTDPWEDTYDQEEDSYLEEDAPQYRVNAEGELVEDQEGDEETLAEEGLEEEPLEEESRPIDPNTFVRFKASANSRFAIQVTEQFDELAASYYLKQLREQGIDAYLAIKNPDSPEKSYAVRVGTFTDRSVAEDFAADLSNRLQRDLQVVLID